MNKMILTAALLLSALAQAASYKMDPAHSAVGFSVKHMMISKVRGNFTKYEGTFDFDEKKNEVNKIVVKVDPASINTGNEKRDEHLRTPDFFDVKKFPEMIFKAGKVDVKKDTPVKVSGELTMHGVTKPVTLDLTYGGAVIDPMGNEKVGFTLTGQINRKEWGLTWNKPLEKGMGVAVGDEVTLEIEGEAAKAK